MIVDKEYYFFDFGCCYVDTFGTKIRYFYIAAIVCMNIFISNSVKPHISQIIMWLKNKK